MFFSLDFIIITLKICWSIGLSESHYLILVISIFCLENCFLFILFLNFFLIIYTYQSKLDKFFGSFGPTQKLLN